MRRIEILAGIMGVLSLTYGQGATAQVRNTVCDTISYEFIEEKIIIPVTVNGVKAKYIVDTGGKTGTLYDAATEMKASAAGYMSVTDVNTQAANFQEAYIKDLTIGSNYRVKQLKTMVFPKNSFFTSLDVVGILGGDAFAESVVTFDSRTQIMVINYPYRPERLKVTDGIPLLTDAEYHSFMYSWEKPNSAYCSTPERMVFSFTQQKTTTNWQQSLALRSRTVRMVLSLQVYPA